MSSLVLKRCISGLPTNECPFIPKRFIEQYQSRHTRSILLDHIDDAVDDQHHDHYQSNSARLPRGAANFSDLIALSQLGIEQPALCEERRKLGQQILIEKGHNVDSLLSRFVGNFIMHFSNLTESQEVSVRMDTIYLFNCFTKTVRWMFAKKNCIWCNLPIGYGYWICFWIICLCLCGPPFGTLSVIELCSNQYLMFGAFRSGVHFD